MFDKSVKKFKDYINEKSELTSINEENLDKEKERKARIIVNKSVIWINVNRGFFGRLLSNLNIYGSSGLNPKTMCTNGLNIIYHPEFVLSQGKGAVNFVLCHEILHCVADHMGRRGTRDPKLWNYACDYAINPILNAEVGRDFEWPKMPDGSRMGLLEEKYAGMRAEDIYDLLLKDQESGKGKGLPYPSDWDFGEVQDSDKDLDKPDSSDSIVQDVRAEEGEEDEEGEKGGKIPKPGEEGEEGDGKGSGKDKKDSEEDGSGDSSIVGKQVTVTAGPNAGKTGIVKQVLPNGDIII